MAKRGYKLQSPEEFVAHSSGVSCLRIGKKACRLLLTGGDDNRVNLWAIGKPTSLMSLCGHTSPVECLAFNSSETLVLGGASSGAIKLWDLEEAKMVRTLIGHRSNCTSVEFHPFGEFLASGSRDADLKIWDMRKKGCIHTYKGHGLGIDTIKFTPDGRWVVSGGHDNVVKIWDLTAGKVLHDFKFHDGPIRSLDFHPLEFLLATGSADRTVKFWDLETFEMIGSARTKSADLGALSFHPDGRALFCGCDDNLKVFSWEPVVCHDSVNMGWSMLDDLCISDTKIIACSHHGNSAGIWVADLSFIKPYGTDNSPEDNSPKMKPEPQGSPYIEKVGTTTRSTSSSRAVTPDDDAKEIKNIYVDYEKPIDLPKARSHRTQRMSPPSVNKDVHKLSTKKRNPVAVSRTKREARSQSFVVPSFVPRDSSDGKNVASSRRESLFSARPGSSTSVKPVHSRRASYSTLEGPSAAESRSSDGTTDSEFEQRNKVEEGSSEFFEDKYPTCKNAEENLRSSGSMSRPSSSETAAVNRGRTRTLVEKFERRDRSLSSDDLAVERNVNAELEAVADRIQSSTFLKEEPQVSGRESESPSDERIIEEFMQGHDALLSSLRHRLTKLQVVRHYWERNDITGAVNAMKKLPDHSVQADVMSVFMDKMEIINLDMFSCLLPVLSRLLNSKIERHAKMSLEMLLKLVATFGETIRSAAAAPPSVGVDLHQEHRIGCCRQCFTHLRKVHENLPALMRTGGSLAKSALELNLVLSDHNIA